MKIEEIKLAVDSGKTVHWVNTDYIVIKDSFGQYLIKYTPDGFCIGLTNRAGDKLNGRPDQFYTAEDKIDSRAEY